jgi:MraZ protein
MFKLWGHVDGSGEKWQAMLLTGTYERALDDKLRLALPKRLRELLAGQGQLVLTPGTDGSLALFPQAAFAAMAEKLASRSPTGQDVRAFSRLLYAQSHSVEVDSQGRMRLPVELARLAALEGEVVLLGVGDRVELWNKPRWERYLADLTPRYDQLAESALSSGPPAPLNTVSPTTPTSAPNESEGVRPSQPR